MKPTDADMEAAQKIVGKPGERHFHREPREWMRDSIAKAVAEGIALGRAEGTKLAVDNLQAELNKIFERIRSSISN